MKSIIFVVFALLITLGCSHKNPGESIKTMDVVLAPPPIGNHDKKENSSDDAPENSLTDTTKKIIKFGEISFVSGNLNATRTKILLSLKRLNGYVAEESERKNGENNRREQELKLRIPAKNFDLLLDSVSQNADKIDSKSVSVKDVTTEFIDIKTQLANKKILENTYLELLKKANKISDVLQIESKLTEIRTSIDSTQGELNYLSKQVAYSSLTITFYDEQIQQDAGAGFGNKFKLAIIGGWNLLQNLFFGLITLWPYILLIVLLYALVKRWRKKTR